MFHRKTVYYLHTLAVSRKENMEVVDELLTIPVFLSIGQRSEWWCRMKGNQTANHKKILQVYHTIGDQAANITWHFSSLAANMILISTSGN